MIEDTGGKRFRRKASTVMTQINVTPFVDVMLVLLVIFLITAPMMQSGVSIDLPKEDTGTLEIKEENVVSVRGDGHIFYNDKRITEQDLTDKLKTLASVAPKTEVFLRADKGLEYGAVMKVMGIIKRAGIANLGMVTEYPVGSEK